MAARPRQKRRSSLSQNKTEVAFRRPLLKYLKSDISKFTTRKLVNAGSKLSLHGIWVESTSCVVGYVFHLNTQWNFVLFCFWAAMQHRRKREDKIVFFRLKKNKQKGMCWDKTCFCHFKFESCDSYKLFYLTAAFTELCGAHVSVKDSVKDETRCTWTPWELHAYYYR